MAKKSSNPGSLANSPTKSNSNTNSPSKRKKSCNISNNNNNTTNNTNNNHNNINNNNNNQHVNKEDDESIYFDDDISYDIIQKSVHSEENESIASDIADIRSYSLDEKLNNPNKYNSKLVKFLDAKEFDYKYIETNGFAQPLVFKEKMGLGLRVPSENFKVSDVKSCVGSKRMIDVIDSNTQKGFTMSMKDWCEYYDELINNPNKKCRDRLLNVISLEFSHTKLENYVEAPFVVRQLDWIETAWPQYLRQQQSESTNLIEKMHYPKVQKYVLMSVKDCYTDFHIDMGGTSVWYHVLKGEKVFWLIPPTETNLNKYIKWIKDGKQSDQFLADMCENCERIVLKQGWTFMLPSGWIHSVYTTKDSLVFGGNFLHSFNIEMQLKIYQIENKIKVQPQCRYPFFIEMIWFVVERYVHCLTGVTHANISETSLNRAYKTFEPTNLNLNKYELMGLNALYKFIIDSKLLIKETSIPKQLVQPEILLNSLKIILDNYNLRREDSNDVINYNDENTIKISTPFIHWPKPEKKYLKKINNSSTNLTNVKKSEDSNTNLNDNLSSINSNNNNNSNIVQSRLSELILLDGEMNSSSNFLNNGTSNNSLNNKKADSVAVAGNVCVGIGNESRKHVMRNLPRTKGSIKKRLRPQNVPRSNVERRRRVRCHRCEPCTRDDCGECKYCKDMKKFGGTGISKQCCLSKQCLQPFLPTTTTCMLCESLIDRSNSDLTNIMYECEICFEIFHAQCFRKQYGHLADVEPIINEDLNNCWTCANCVYKGYTKPDQNMSTNQNNSINSNHRNENSYSFNNNKMDFFLNNSGSNSLNTSFNSISNNADNSGILPIMNTTVNNKKKYSKKKPNYENNNDIIFKPENNNTKNYTITNNMMNNGIINSNNNIDMNNKDNNSKKVKQKQPRQPKYKRYDDESIVRIEELTDYEKDVIMREFCEIVVDSNFDNSKLDDQNMSFNNDEDDDLEIASIKVLKDEDSNMININSNSIMQENTNNNNNDEFFYMDDDNIEYEIENGTSAPEITTTATSLNVNTNNGNRNNNNDQDETTSLSFDSIIVNNNNDSSSSVSSNSSTKNSYYSGSQQGDFV